MTALIGLFGSILYSELDYGVNLGLRVRAFEERLHLNNSRLKSRRGKGAGL